MQIVNPSTLYVKSWPAVNHNASVTFARLIANMSFAFTRSVAAQGKVWLTYNLEHDREEDDAVDEDDTMDEDEDEEGAWDLGEKSDSDVERYISFQR